MKNILVQIGNVLRTRDFWIRVLFVAIAAFFWLLIKLSKSGYVSKLEYPVTYINIPKSKVMVKPPPKSITLRVSSYGFRLLGYELKNSKPIQIDVKRSARQLGKDRNIFYWLPNLYRDELQAQLDAQTSLLRLEPDTVFFVLSDRVKKRVPVISEVIPEFANGYRQYQPAQLKPTHVTISGPGVYIDSIAYVKTEALRITDINDDVKQKVAIDFGHPLIAVNPPVISYQMEVDQFTEKKITLPIKLRNIPEDNKVNIYPASVDVYCKVALRDYAKLDESVIKAICDLDQLKQHPNRARLQIDIVCEVPNVEIGRVSHKSVDFLIF